MKLVLGVLDVAYSDAGSSGATTTGDVAKILEDRYHVMETFYESRRQQVGEWLADSVADAIDGLVKGRNVKPTFDAEQKIEASFRAYLSANEWSGIVPLTQQITAAQMGVSHRKKHPYASKNKERPAFIDTGLYQASFRAWIES
ncbi:MAG: hypothetical protein ACYC3L_00905 [Gemmatimonadaceae bacterium]